MNVDVWLVFLGGVLLSAILPGAGAIMTINHAFQWGWRKTLPLIIGQETALGLMVPIVAISVEVLRSSTFAWFLLKIIGIFWLFFLAYKTWRSPVMKNINDVVILTSGVKRFFCGFLTDITNAKTLAFLVAILPVFINPKQSLILQIGIMTLTMVIIDTFMMSLYAFIASWLRPFFQSSRILKQQNYIFASFLILIAISICFIKDTF
ncbi:LysE family translocator [Arsenophonus symbiont of Ornithomya chloropus]|uniref:LysE family translocator n=1 Tax=Arsenophonus symbiont of Ornithomya chloropus TaxID=634121 RepID=UPI0032B237D3